ncbi:MAG: aldolase/citrate lyase family protein [Omnitrophica bacterium]|nr:aldolase/citrate lyase family protein [Candidatus Omnitrophota bacterium]
MNSLKEKLKANKQTLGSWITLPDTAICEIMTKAGFDWLTVDMEHSAITLHQAQELIRVVELGGCVPLVRVGKNDPNLIKRVMDAGAHGVIVPMVNCREDAISAVSSVKYPPHGKRGVGLARAQGYGLTFEKYREWVSSESVVIVQIEHIDAIKNLEVILEVEGVDASMIGPYDLSASLGYPGDFKKKEIVDAIKKYTDICDKLKKPGGFHVIEPEAEKLKDRLKEGFKFMAFSFDALFLGNKIKEELEGVKGLR